MANVWLESAKQRPARACAGCVLTVIVLVVAGCQQRSAPPGASQADAPDQANPLVVESGESPLGSDPASPFRSPAIPSYPPSPSPFPAQPTPGLLPATDPLAGSPLAGSPLDGDTAPPDSTPPSNVPPPGFAPEANSPSDPNEDAPPTTPGDPPPAEAITDSNIPGELTPRVANTGNGRGNPLRTESPAATAPARVNPLRAGAANFAPQRARPFRASLGDAPPPTDAGRHTATESLTDLNHHPADPSPYSGRPDARPSLPADPAGPLGLTNPAARESATRLPATPDRTDQRVAERNRFRFPPTYQRQPLTPPPAPPPGAPSPNFPPSDAALPDAAPSEAAPSDAAPSDAAPPDAAPPDAAPSDAAPSEDVPAEAAPPAAAPFLPGRNGFGGAAPRPPAAPGAFPPLNPRPPVPSRETSGGDANPGAATSGDANPGAPSISDPPTSGEAASGAAAPGESASGAAAPGSAATGDYTTIRVFYATDRARLDAFDLRQLSWRPLPWLPVVVLGAAAMALLTGSIVRRLFGKAWVAGAAAAIAAMIILAAGGPLYLSQFNLGSIASRLGRGTRPTPANFAANPANPANPAADLSAASARSAASAPSDRSSTTPASADIYGDGRGDLEVGECEVTIPRRHEPGHIERPSLWRLEFHESPDRHVVLRSVERREDEAFFDAVRKRVAASPRGDLFVFIHGYNVSFDMAARRTAQMAHDLRFQGAPIFYSWPSQGGLLKYPVDETNVAWTVPHLKQFLRHLAARSQARAMNIIAHSMGNRALAAAIRELSLEQPRDEKRFHQIVLAAPDIDAEVFKRDVAPLMARSAEHVTLYASSRDQALAASKLVHGYPRAGDSGANLLVIPGIETVDVTEVDTGILGHSYYGNSVPILRDLERILHGALAADQRPWLQTAERNGQAYWVFNDQSLANLRANRRR